MGVQMVADMAVAPQLLKGLSRSDQTALAALLRKLAMNLETTEREE